MTRSDLKRPLNGSLQLGVKLADLSEHRGPPDHASTGEHDLAATPDTHSLEASRSRCGIPVGDHREMSTPDWTSTDIQYQVRTSPAVDALDRDHVHDRCDQSIRTARSGGEHGDLAAMGHVGEHLLERRGAPDTSSRHRTLTHAELAHRVGDARSRHVERERQATDRAVRACNRTHP